MPNVKKILPIVPFGTFALTLACLGGSMFLGGVLFVLGIILALATIGLTGFLLFSHFKSGEYVKDRYGDSRLQYTMPIPIPQIVVSVIALIACLGVGIASTEVVDAGEVEVITNSPTGNAGVILEEGWHFSPSYILASKDTIRINTQTSEFIGGDDGEDRDGCITVMSKDGSTINIDISITYHIPLGKVKDLRFNYGHDWADTIINQAIRTEPRTICAEYEATQFISADRATIETALITALTAKVQSYGNVVVDSVQIKEFRIPAAVTAAVQAKLIALQTKEKAETEAETLKIQAEAQATADKIAAEAQAAILVIEAQGRADSIAKIQGEFTSEKEYLQYLYLQALTDPNRNVQYVVPNGSTIVVGA